MAVSIGSGLWLFCTTAVFLFYFLVFYLFPKVEVLSRLYLMGKLRERESKSRMLAMLDIPKRWFSHFYIVGALVNATLLFLLARQMLFNIPLPQTVQEIFTVFWSPNTQPEKIQMTSVLVVLVLEEIQVIRRSYECFYVSVFSNSRISIVHYAMGILFYLTFGTCLLSSTDFNNFKLSAYTDQTDIICLVVGCLMFAVFSLFQHQTLVIFAKLRKSHKGVVENTQHLLPHGGLFEYVSCPHFFCEIVIYLAMNIILKFQHQAVLCIGFFVLLNQVIMALMTHSWYRANFRMYPKNRKAIFPLLL